MDFNMCVDSTPVVVVLKLSYLGALRAKFYALKYAFCELYTNLTLKKQIRVSASTQMRILF